MSGRHNEFGAFFCSVIIPNFCLLSSALFLSQGSIQWDFEVVAGCLGRWVWRYMYCLLVDSFLSSGCIALSTPDISATILLTFQLHLVPCGNKNRPVGVFWWFNPLLGIQGLVLVWLLNAQGLPPCPCRPSPFTQES